jgi:hypothetical protein
VPTSATLINKSRRPRIIGYRKNWQPIWSIAGGSSAEDDPDDDDAGDDAHRDTRGAGGAKGGTGGKRADADGDSSDDEGDGEADDPGSLKRRVADLQNEAKKHRLGKRDIQKELDAVKKELAATQDKEKDAETRLTEERDALQKTVTGLEELNRKLRLQVAFLSDNSYEWHDPDDALRLADLSEVEIDEDNLVIGLDEALKDLAKRKPHLIKTNKRRTSVQSGSREDDGATGEGRTGDTGAGSNRPSKTQLETDRLKQKYGIRR